MVSIAVIIVVALTVFWLVLYSLFGKKEIDPETGEPVEKEEGLSVDFLIAMWRTKRLLGFIDRLARRAPRFWLVYGNLGVLIGFAGMVYIFYVLLRLALKNLQGAKSSAVTLVIPGVTIPLWYGLIGLAVVMVVHELSHGVVARAEGIPLKSVGVLLLVVIPGAFVEPDEEALKRAPLIKRLRVYGAGSLANIITAFLALLITVALINPILQPDGVLISGVLSNGPSHGILQKGDVIVSMKGEKITTLDDFLKFMNSTKPGQVVEISVLRGGHLLKVSVVLGKNPRNPSMGFLGVYPAQNIKSKVGYDWLVIPLAFSLYWIYILNIGIGLMNLFPLVPLDGGRMLDETLKEFLPEEVAKPLRFSIIGLGVFLLAVNLIPALANLLG